MASILIIDDDENFRVALERMLVAAGHVVTTATDGLEGAVRYRANPTDIVLLDMVMPHSGLMTLRVLRSQYPGIRIIAMTGGAPFRLGFARNIGVPHTLVKPFTSEQLADVIAVTLAGNVISPES
ncbi:MAG: response regulator [Opitutaceae bacterium]|nr:response regulator [Opitutaceae bacterium]